jgi:hypothetical protein
VPKDDAWYQGVYQMGLAIVSSPRLESAFIAYKKGLMTIEEILNSLQEKADDVEYEWMSATPSRRPKKVRCKK